jgi:hypothetical protein
VTLYDQISEETFTEQVVNMAMWFGWRVMHQRPARTKNSWRTAIMGHAGFPDVIALRVNRRLLAELKSAKGKLTDEQKKWLQAAREADFEVYLWRPSDIDKIERILR